MQNTQASEELSVKQRLAHTLMELMNTVPYSKISVSTIVEASGISRATFYRHFADKNELLQWSYLYVVVNDAIGLDCIEEWDDKVVAYCQSFKSYTSFYKKAFAYMGQNTLFETKWQHSDETITERVKRAKKVDELDEELVYAIKHYNRGNVQMLHDWVMAGAPGTAEHMAEMLLLSVPVALAPYLIENK